MRAWDQTPATMVGGPFDGETWVPLSATIEVALAPDPPAPLPEDEALDRVVSGRRGVYKARRHSCCQRFVHLPDGSVPFDYEGPAT